MPLSDKALTSALSKTVRDVFHSDEKDKLSVRFIRTKVEEEYELGDGFLNEGKWKEKSKGIIKGEVDKLMQGDEEGKEEEEVSVKAKNTKKTPAKKVTPAAKPTKRSSAEKKAPPPKRQKKEKTPASESELSEPAESELSDIGSEMSEDVKANSDDEIGDNEDEVAPKKTKKSATKAVVTSGSELSDIESITQSEAKSPKPSSPKIRDSSLSSLPKTEEEAAGNESDSSAMSVVLDGPLTTKSRSKKSKSTSTKPSKTTKAAKPKAAKAKTTAELTPNEQLIKTLQSQLVKCGIRKIWAFELKKYETENEKIKHLKNMLTEIGMTGRFSEGRAREIKEMRELQADLEAVKEGEKAWGMGRSSRRSGSGVKEDKKKSESSDDDDDAKSKSGSTKNDDEESEDDDDDEDMEVSVRARRKNDLAFLGSEESSDDD
ncbi:putative transcriptional regulator protein [Botrytis fragariae]|uniref:Putative transcriptional regulator protein n=1 Tax=Botrytis fragariae TaxID=1964551 RepID=A0A8H6EG54_9HELO|nr:putative transcriptional regulator protein [Botrytis fragariae]KAF5870690.1 putative transcriptional regulator protein [Botrytis fragariae]